MNDSPIATTTVEESFYCTELTVVTAAGVFARSSRDMPNEAWGTLGIIANVVGDACTEWSGYDPGTTVQVDPFTANTSINTVFFADFIYISGLILFSLFLIFIGMVFNSSLKKPR